jgi:hypothetical protein
MHLSLDYRARPTEAPKTKRTSQAPRTEQNRYSEAEDIYSRKYLYFYFLITQYHETADLQCLHFIQEEDRRGLRVTLERWFGNGGHTCLPRH